MGRGEGQFDPADATADDDNLRRGQVLGQKRLPARGIGAQGFGGNGVFGKAGCVGQVRGDADIQAAQVIVQRRAVLQQDALRRPVDPGGAVKDQARPGKAAEADKVDHQVGPAVMPGDQTGQHAGVGGCGVGVDQGQAHAGQRVHGPHAQDQGMGMAPADQNKVADQRDIRVLHQHCLLRCAGDLIARLRPS